ncbi:MAG: M15 family metallopeptidase [Acidobacteria bacterium]|nr:M15 family metallopeptidase [Acidobacteriota bacterium]
MTLDPVTERRLKDIHPILAEKVRKLAELLHPEGVQFRVTQGLRSWSEQEALYAQGRTVPGPKVTNAKPGQSWHNYGCAVDVAPDNPALPGYQPDWNLNHPAWKRLIDVAESIGLRSGKAWNDSPHLEYTGRFGPTPNGEIKYLYEGGGLKAVWDAIGGA